VELGAGGNVVEAAFPGEILRDEVLGDGVSLDGRGEGGKKSGADLRSVGEDGGALEGVLEFADVAGPRVIAEAAAGFGAEGERRLSQFAAKFFEEVGSEEKNVVAAIAQGRNRERNGGDAEVEIFTKEFFTDAGGEIAVGGNDDAEVHVNGLRATDAFKAAFFEDAKELGLAGQGQFADFVEEEGAALREFDFADFAIAGAGEGAAFVTEEFVFEERVGNGGAIESDERLLAAMRKLMDGAGEEFLAGAAFAEKQNGGVGGSDFLELMTDGLHGRGFADDAREAVTGGEFFAQDEIFAEEFLLAGGALDEKLEVIEVHRLLNEVESAFFHGGDGFFYGTESGEKNYRNGGVGLFGFAKDFEAGGAGHFEVGEDHLVAAGAKLLDGGRAVGGFFDGMAVALESLAEHGAQLGFVFDEEERFHVVSSFDRGLGSVRGGGEKSRFLASLGMTTERYNGN